MSNLIRIENVAFSREKFAGKAQLKTQVDVTDFGRTTKTNVIVIDLLPPLTAVRLYEPDLEKAEDLFTAILDRLDRNKDIPKL